MLSSLRAPTFLLLLCLGALPRASGFSFFGGGGKEDESGSEEDNAIVEHKPSEDGSDVPPWYGDFGFSHDYGMGDEFQNLRGFGKSPDPEFDFKEPTKSPEELHEEFFRAYDLDENDVLDEDELRRALLQFRLPISDDKGNDLVVAAVTKDDMDNDGALSLHEYLLARKTLGSGINRLGNLEL
uniref:Putative secreted protein n=1 Tax=Ixodes ricinus TaxID=34613 RepID=A0A147BLI6_IXORI